MFKWPFLDHPACMSFYDFLQVVYYSNRTWPSLTLHCANCNQSGVRHRVTANFSQCPSSIANAANFVCIVGHVYVQLL